MASGVMGFVNALDSETAACRETIDGVLAEGRALEAVDVLGHLTEIMKCIKEITSNLGGIFFYAMFCCFFFFLSDHPPNGQDRWRMRAKLGHDVVAMQHQSDSMGPMLVRAGAGDCTTPEIDR